MTGSLKRMRRPEHETDALREYAQWVLEPPLPERPATPRRSCVICATPRSGSWLLSGLLHSTGVAGHPHEYFFRDTEAANRRNWRVSSSAEYLARVLDAGTTGNGVFSCKVMWGVLPHFLRQLNPPAAPRLDSDRMLIERFFPSPRFVFVWREDVVAQAVSWAKAIQTGYWHHWDSVKGSPRFDREQVDSLVRETAKLNAAWRGWFAANGIVPLEVRFEDLVADMEGETRRVLRHLEIDLPESAAIAERTVKTGDAVDEEWRGRCRARS